jgi:hypothetical protein
MRRVAIGAGMLLLLAVAGGCSGVEGSSATQLPRSAYSGTGDLMAACMQYRSESYCERQIWGGGEL